MRQGQQHRRGRGRSNNNNNHGGNSGNNNNRRGHNPLARSFESNGPDVKVRGTPADIASKYLSLARDAQSSGDPVLAENYFQHAEHYNRIIMAYREQQTTHDGANGNNPRIRQDGPSFNEGGADDFGDEEPTEDLGLGDQPMNARGSGDQPRSQEARDQGRDQEARSMDQGQGQPRPHDDGGRPHRPHDQQQQRYQRHEPREPRGERFPRHERGERHERGNERHQRPDRGDRADRGDRGEYRQGGNRGYDRPLQQQADPMATERPTGDRDRGGERGPPMERPERFERPVRQERPERPEREQIERIDRAALERASIERAALDRDTVALPQDEPDRPSRVRPVAEEPQPVIEATPPPAPRAERPEGAPRRRGERYGLSPSDQPEFLRRPVRRPRRDPDAAPAAESTPPPEEPTGRE